MNKIDINVTRIQCLEFLSPKHKQLIINSCNKMLFGPDEGRVDRWKRLCDVCIHMDVNEGKLWRVDSEDDFAVCYNM